jgi:hypothetical protein
MNERAMRKTDMNIHHESHVSFERDTAEEVV